MPAARKLRACRSGARREGVIAEGAELGDRLGSLHVASPWRAGRGVVTGRCVSSGGVIAPRVISSTDQGRETREGPWDHGRSPTACRLQSGLGPWGSLKSRGRIEGVARQRSPGAEMPHDRDERVPASHLILRVGLRHPSQARCGPLRRTARASRSWSATSKERLGLML